MDRSEIFSEVKDLGGVPTLFVNGKPFTSAAYMTYLEKFNRYDDFVKAGYRFFSVPVLFSGRWIRHSDSLVPFKRGIFDIKGQPDYSVFNEAIDRILAVCPDAYIIPRVNISMPEWWENENPQSVNIVDGKSRRESFYSDKWLADAADLLRQFTAYAHCSKYSRHIIGYHIAGGSTEEWFHFDLNAGYCKNADNGFRAFLEKHYPKIKFCGLPDLALLNQKTNFFKNEYLTCFLEYASLAVAEAVSHLASVVKEVTKSSVVAGVFYGYSLEVTDPLWGTHALKLLLDDRNIDFFCSPNSYWGIRNPDNDWTEMFPADSVRLHGKMCFQECDIRTHLTVPLPQKDPSTDPCGTMYGAIWKPVKDKYTAVNMLRKSFCRQLIKGNGLWWFDMWGGWYADKDIMNEMKTFRYIYNSSLKCENRASKSQVAVFTDESAYRYMTNCSLRNAPYNQRNALGLMGTSYDAFDIYDFEAVYRKYKAVIFISGAETDYLKNALSLCRKSELPYLIISETKQNFSAEELFDFLSKNGVHIYCKTNDIVYINENYLAIYAVSGGEKSIDLGKKYCVAPLIGKGDSICTDTYRVTMRKGETKLFRIGENYD